MWAWRDHDDPFRAAGGALWPARLHTRAPCVSAGCNCDWLLNTSMCLLRHQQKATRLQLLQASIYKYPHSFSGTHFSPLNFCLISITHFLWDQLKMLCLERSKQTLHSVSEAEENGFYISSSPPLSVLGADVLTRRADPRLQAVWAAAHLDWQDLIRHWEFGENYCDFSANWKLIFKIRQQDKPHSFILQHEQSSEDQ